MASFVGNRANYNNNRAVRVDDVTDLVSRDLGHIDVPFEIGFAEVSTTSTTFVTILLLTAHVWMPDYAAALFFNARFEGKTTAGTGTAKMKLGTAAFGANVTWTETVYTGKTLQCPTPTGETSQNLQIDAQVTSPDTFFMRSTLGLVCWFSTS